jgi:colanic acid/amylovoran biosynthesis protein
MSAPVNKKIAIVWANPYNKNLGVGALAYSALAIFHDILKENNIDGDITFVGSYKSGKDAVTIGGERMEFDNIIGLDYLRLKSFAKMILKPAKFRIGKLFTFDYIYDLAEGDSFADIYGDFRFFRIYNSKRVFSFLGKKQVLLPQTIGPFTNPVRERQAKAIMHKMEMVISRDKKSYDYTAAFLPKDKIAEMIDVAFYLPFDKTIFDNKKTHIGINVSGLLWNGGYTGKNQFNLKTDYQKLIRETINYFRNQENIQIHLVSHVIPENSPVEDDSAVAAILKAEYPDVIISPRFETPIEAKSYISGMDFFTGARMHACIAAFSAGVAVVPMAYSRKFNGLFGDTLQYAWVGDCVNETEDVVLDKIVRGFQNKKELEQLIEKSNQTIVKPRLTKLKEILLQSLKK